MRLVDLDPCMVAWWRMLGAVRATPELWHDYPWRRSSFYTDLATQMAAEIWDHRVPFYFQVEPNLRIQRPGSVCVPWHSDSMFGHGDYQMNVWIPLTPITDDSQCMWIDETPLGPHPVHVGRNQAFIFNGSTIRHGNVPNETDQTRLSMDFRLMRQEDYKDLGIKTVEYEKALRLGEYWRAP